jgi:AcrR family transcriptional regulator
MPTRRPEPPPETSRRLREKKDRRSEATRAALIEQGEAMFAEGGIEGTSLRQIGAAIGSANTNVVSYHFGSKEALIEAILRNRLPALEGRRAELLAIAENDKCGHELSALMAVLWRPLFEQMNSDGHHSYGRFLASLIRSGSLARRAISAPVTDEIIARVRAAAKIPPRFFETRFQVNALMITGALQMIDLMSDKEKAQYSDELFADTLRMATAAISISSEYID